MGNGWLPHEQCQGQTLGSSWRHVATTETRECAGVLYQVVTPTPTSQQLDTGPGSQGPSKAGQPSPREASTPEPVIMCVHICEYIVCLGTCVQLDHMYLSAVGLAQE